MIPKISVPLALCKDKKDIINTIIYIYLSGATTSDDMAYRLKELNIGQVNKNIKKANN